MISFRYVCFYIMKLTPVRNISYGLQRLNQMKIKSFLLTIFLILFCLSNMVHAEEKNLHIKIDLFEKKLYVLDNYKTIEQFSISIGTDLSPSPIGTYTITEKAKSWGGGFGSRWLGLDVPWGIYGIHGTNKPHLIGENISSGCIRLNNNDVEKLYEIISEGATVKIEGPIMGIGEGEYKNLSVGSTGNLVQLVQERLKGYHLYNGEINGIYGVKTEFAVREFQKMNELSINGVVSFREYLLLGLLE